MCAWSSSTPTPSLPLEGLWLRRRRHALPSCNVSNEDNPPRLPGGVQPDKVSTTNVPLPSRAGTSVARSLHSYCASTPLDSARICSLSVPGGGRDAWRGSILWLARHRAVRARQARRHEVDQGVRLSRRARHGDAGMDTREKLPPLASGNAAMPDVRLARRAADLHRSAGSADGSRRKVRAESFTAGEPAPSGPIEPACVPSP